MTPESQHAIGIRGVFNAKSALERLLPGVVDLPFNAYDSSEKLEFKDPDGGNFLFDLGGRLRRASVTAILGEETCELLVEAKNYANGSTLLSAYKTFLRHASIAAGEKRHKNSWFLFLSSVPFGSTHGVKMCNGKTLADEAQTWSPATPQPVAGLHNRIALVFWTASTERLVDYWRAS